MNYQHTFVDVPVLGKSGRRPTKFTHTSVCVAQGTLDRDDVAPLSSSTRSRWTTRHLCLHRRRHSRRQSAQPSAPGSQKLGCTFVSE